jgi:acyl-CoA synthetase (AMP-forming)/AMP-acid ligase II
MRLWQALATKAEGDGAVYTATARRPWSHVFDLASQIRDEAAPLRDGTVGVVAPDAALAIAALAAFEQGDGRLALLPYEVPQVDEVLDYRLGYDTSGNLEIRRAGSGPTRATEAEGGSLTIFSSGTTGAPRPHRWPWTDLVRRAVAPPSIQRGYWCTAYPVATFAGLQAVLSGCCGPEHFIALQPDDPLSSVRRWTSHLTLATGTPTFWRRTLLLDDEAALRALTIETLSMGGEPATQDLLDRLNAVFPGTRCMHIYGSSEHGPLFSVSDGQAGFPARWLSRPLRSGHLLAVRDGELYVAPGPAQPFVPTGDAVEVSGDRVFFLGRVQEQIIVGGRKISPLQVEDVLRMVPGVSDVSVYGIASPITGQLVAADVVLDEGASEEAVVPALHARCRESLAAPERPRRVRVVAALPVSPASKRRRLPMAGIAPSHEAAPSIRLA